MDKCKGEILSRTRWIILYVTFASALAGCRESDEDIVSRCTRVLEHMERQPAFNCEEYQLRKYKEDYGDTARLTCAAEKRMYYSEYNECVRKLDDIEHEKQFSPVKRFIRKFMNSL